MILIRMLYSGKCCYCCIYCFLLKSIKNQQMNSLNLPVCHLSLWNNNFCLHYSSEIQLRWEKLYLAQAWWSEYLPPIRKTYQSYCHFQWLRSWLSFFHFLFLLWLFLLHLLWIIFFNIIFFTWWFMIFFVVIQCCVQSFHLC